MPVMENFFLKIEFRDIRDKNVKPLRKILILKRARMKKKIKF